MHAQSCPALCDPMDCSLPGSSVHVRQEYWSGLPYPPPGNLSDQGSNLRLLPCQTYSSPLRHMGSPGLSGGLSKPINVEYGWHKLSAKQRVVVMTRCLSFHQLPLAGTWVFLWFRQDYCSNKIHWQKNSFSWKRVFALLIFYSWCALEDKCTSVF